MARITMIAKDGARFGVYNQGHGDYVAAEDDSGTHYAPSQWQSLPSWSDATAKARLRDAVADYDARCQDRVDAEQRGDCPACGQRGPLPADHYDRHGNCCGS